jgi:hypothetical protein
MSTLALPCTTGQNGDGYLCMAGAQHAELAHSPPCDAEVTAMRKRAAIVDPYHDTPLSAHIHEP